ncbi:tail fiber assembly protein [Pantoea anthophila]|uniref:tail fiber assembly protein n=1 Tax=Pantoea anthophila TaxID=470931 RepID=UPI003018B48F
MQAAIDTSATLANTSNKDALMNEASQRISVLQDAVDLDMATEEESTALPLWKKYRVLLSRVDADTPSEIQWPQKP